MNARNIAIRSLFVIGVVALHVDEVCGDGSDRRLRASHNRALKGSRRQKLRALTSRSIQSVAECPKRYAPSKTYASGDIVSLSGVAYRCKSGMAFQYCSMFPPDYSIRAAGDSPVVHETRDDLGWVRLFDCEDDAPSNNEKRWVGEDVNQRAANYRQGSFAKRRSRKSNSELRRHDRYRLKGHIVSKTTKQPERNYRTKGKGDSSENQLRRPKGYRLNGSSTSKTPKQAKKNRNKLKGAKGKEKGMKKGVRKGVKKGIKKGAKSKFTGDNRYSSSDKNEVTLGATDVIVKDRYKPNAGYSEMLIRFDLSRVDIKGVASMDIEATLHLYFLENCNVPLQIKALADDWAGRNTKWYNVPYRAGPASAQPRVPHDQPRRNEWYDVDVARALLWGIRVKGQRHLTFRVSLDSGDDYACIAASGYYRGGKYSPTLGIRLYREKGGSEGKVRRPAQKKQRTRPRLDEFNPDSKVREYAPIQRDAVQDQPSWYVDYSLGEEGQCVQNCKESQGTNCGGIASDWDELHSSSRECCEEKLCAPRWYVDYSRGTEGQCVANCDEAEGPNCGGVARTWDKLYSSSKACCEGKLWWMGRKQCSPGAS
ncbi:hypothetical protein ACHAWF_006577 [Thalassiosira exigua]